MDEWLAGMSENLIADVLLVLLLLYGGRWFLDLATFKRVWMSVESDVRRVELEDGEEELTVYRVRFVNNSNEPVYNPWFQFERQVPDSVHLMNQADQRMGFLADEGGERVLRLAAGQEAFSPWRSPGVFEVTTVRFETVRGRCFTKTLHMPD